MLVEDLFSLPVGTRVFGVIDATTRLSGVIASTGDGFHVIRWEDGYSTVALGKVREYDEYIAAHTELQRTRHLSIVRNAELHKESSEASPRKYTALVTRA